MNEETLTQAAHTAVHEMLIAQLLAHSHSVDLDALHDRLAAKIMRIGLSSAEDAPAPTGELADMQRTMSAVMRSIVLDAQRVRLLWEAADGEPPGP